MTYSMAIITKKMIHGKPYYARECKRVDGKPKIVWQQYLGRPEDIINAMTPGPLPVEAMPKPKEAIIMEFGALAALYDLAKRLTSPGILTAMSLSKVRDPPLVSIF
jgi:hypothetical protein